METKIIAHPESPFEVCQKSDYIGSTEYIINTIAEAEPNTRWLVATELNLVNRLHEQFKHEGKNVHFMSPNVCMCSTMFRIDPQHLAWVLENLVENALRHTSAKGAITLRVSIDDGKVKVQISDSGHGIPEGQKTRIFDRFYQADATATRRGEGTGIGLALTKELVKVMGGQIEVESKVGKGSTFYVTFLIAEG